MYSHFKEHTFVSDYDITDAVGNIMLKRIILVFSGSSGSESGGGSTGSGTESDKGNIDYSGSLSSIISNIVGIAEKLPRFLNR